MSKIKAPWTQEQVDGLNRFQVCPWVHPFTCPDDHDLGGMSQPVKAVLAARPEGWVCPLCGYTQDWAHDFMVKGAPPHPMAAFKQRKEDAT
jgi:hypothetical protein